MINVVIPMAGTGSRFASAGYVKPKPFIDVAGKPMIIRVLENLSIQHANFILIARQEHIDKEQSLVKEIAAKFNATFIAIDKLTAGTACTVLFARQYINNNTPLLIANSDQLVDLNLDNFIQNAQERKLDGSILTFIDNEKNPKWSFVKVNEHGLVSQVKEKEAISNCATVGIYYYARGKDFVDAAIDMIAENERVNGEFYTCPTYNYAIRNDAKVGVYNIDYEQMHGLGTPNDLNHYLETECN